MTTLPPSPQRFWLRPLAATLGLQASNAFLSYIIPTLAPEITRAIGRDDGFAGTLASLNTVGAILFLFAGTPFIKSLGSIRVLQLGLLFAGLGLLLLPLPSAIAVGFASVVMGLGYGSSSPAGSDILQRYSPPHRRNLIFSIRQAGVPLSGVIAGLTLPPVFASAGWPGVIGLSLALVLLTVALVQLTRDEIDGPVAARPRLDSAAVFSSSNILEPLRAVFATAGALRLALAGCCLAIGHGNWLAFLVTYLNRELHWSLIEAGQVFSVMQATGVVGRVAVGWLSDRAGSGRLILRAISLASAVATLALGFLAPVSGFAGLLLLSGLAGLAVSSWNGVQYAEIARTAPAGDIAAATAGVTILVFAGFVVGPLAFAALLSVTGHYAVGFTLTAAVTALGFLLLSGRPVSAPN